MVCCTLKILIKILSFDNRICAQVEKIAFTFLASGLEFLQFGDTIIIFECLCTQLS